VKNVAGNVGSGGDAARAERCAESGAEAPTTVMTRPAMTVAIDCRKRRGMVGGYTRLRD
jgi:hypothetical protein